MAQDLLRIRNLHVRFPTDKGVVHAVRGLGLSMGREKLGIVGESGSGKSITGRAVLGLLPSNAKVTADEITFDGMDLQKAKPAALRALRGRRLAMVMQDPKYSLNPVMTVGAQIGETLLLHGVRSARARRERTLAMLEAVKIRDPRRVYDAYPHELSGGMGQRVMIAMMLIAEPDLLIADEPTSALDVTVQNQVLSIMNDLVSSRGMGLIFISHDLNLVASFCDRVIVMYGGQVMETLKASELHQARHPYTQGLIAAMPRIDDVGRDLKVMERDPAWLAPRSEAAQ